MLARLLGKKRPRYLHLDQHHKQQKHHGRSTHCFECYTALMAFNDGEYLGRKRGYHRYNKPSSSFFTVIHKTSVTM